MYCFPYILVYFFGHIRFDFCCSVVKSCLTLFNPMDCSMAGFPVLHCLLEIWLQNDVFHLMRVVWELLYLCNTDLRGKNIFVFFTAELYKHPSWKRGFHRQPANQYFANKDPSSQSYGFFQQSCIDVTAELQRKLNAKELIFLNCGAGEGS